ncbi:MAG: peptidoglycan editing factor PgeF [Sphaerobacter sp.]|nr:peptidoglycan editing factor PgeF [Sphaerobacter sp.]
MQLPVFRFARFDAAAVRHGMTGRTASLPADGTVGYRDGLDRAVVDANRAAWSAAIGVDPSRWTCGRQVHGVGVAVIGPAAGCGADGRRVHGAGERVPATDALVTAEPGVPLVVFCADCVPVLLHDPKRRVVAAIHAGWRGTVADVVGTAVRAMQDHFGSDPRDLIAGLGPSIGPCCYEVGDEVIDAWNGAGIDPTGKAVRRGNGRTVFDLWQANRLALIAAGVPDDQIEVAAVCTRCHADRFFSYRARSTQPGSAAAVIALEGGEG